MGFVALDVDKSYHVASSHDAYGLVTSMASDPFGDDYFAHTGMICYATLRLRYTVLKMRLKEALSLHFHL